MTRTAIVPFTFDGVSYQDHDGGIWFEIVVGLVETPSVRGDDTTIPQNPGSLEGNRVNDVLPIELRGQVYAEATADTETAARASYWENLRTVRQAFRPDRDRAPLVATLPNGEVVEIQARPLNIVSAESVEGAWAEISISLAGDDDWTTAGS